MQSSSMALSNPARTSWQKNKSNSNWIASAYESAPARSRRRCKYEDDRRRCQSSSLSSTYNDCNLLDPSSIIMSESNAPRDNTNEYSNTKA